MMNTVIKFNDYQNLYEGKPIDMYSSQGKKITYNQKSKNKEANKTHEKVTTDDLKLEIASINEKLDQIYSNQPDEKKENNYEITNIRTENVDKKRKKLSSYCEANPFKTSVAASIVASIIITIASMVFNNYLLRPYNNINSRFDSIETTINDIRTSKTKMVNSTDNFKSDILERIDRLETNVANIAYKTGIDICSNLEYTDSFISELAIKSESIENKYYANEPPCKSQDIIAIDRTNGNKYTKKQLIQEKLLIPYTSNGQEILFYGQYDDNYNWDKDCTINVYENNKLILISETEYSNGTPLSSNLMYPYKTKDNKNVWCITNREYDKDKNNIDETWYYFNNNEYEKNFDLKNAKIDDLLYVSQLENEIKDTSPLEGYYRDKVDNNDKKSYMVKNNENGFIRTLYIGKFKNGDFYDQTGSAIEIVFDESVKKYFCYVGTFIKGDRDSDNNLEYKTQDEINEIIKPYEFNCELNWYDTTKDTD